MKPAASSEGPNGTHHIRVDNRITIRDFLAQQSFQPQSIDLWLHMGSIYADGKRLRTNITLEPGQIIRLHTQPKSYNWEAGALRRRLVFDDPEFLVLDKPAGLPVHATLDNFVDNAKYILEQELGQPLFSTHRLDIPTQGLLILAKNKDAQSLINKAFAKRRVEKIYHAITEHPIPLGEHILYIDPESRVPRASSASPKDHWWECRLKILNSIKNDFGFCHKIELLTGKTHQIRAQLAALGAPILGDELYGSNAKYLHGPLALECYSLSFSFRSRALAVNRPFVQRRPSLYV